MHSSDLKISRLKQQENALADECVARIRTIFDERGARMYGEAVTELAHALQCAQAAREHGASDALIIASLLHDIGHLLHDRDELIADQGVDMRHEIIGEKFLRKFFPVSVTRPVGLHVDAKRYLCTVEPAYLDGLSPASRQSLGLQGGLMTPDEIAAFEADPWHEDAVLLRRCDEEGKCLESNPPGLEQYFPLIRQLVTTECTN